MEENLSTHLYNT